VRFFFVLNVFLFLTYFSHCQTVGPENGKLVIAGGGVTSNEIFDTFIELAGGKDASIVIVPTAAQSPNVDKSRIFWTDRGLSNVKVLHTQSRKEANDPSFFKVLEDADGVWFSGGRQWRLVDSYGGTKTEELFHEVLKRGGVIGGSSAGATIQGSYLARGDTQTNQIMMGDHEEGFGFIANVAIDQHVLARNRHFDLFEILQNKPELLGIGLDENTAIVVEGNVFTVIGESYVLIYDSGFWSREGYKMKKLPEPENRFYFLRPGDRYNMRLRQVLD